MDILLWVVAAVALFMAWSARSRAAEMESRLLEAKRLGSAARDEVVELTGAVDTLRKLLARVANGHHVDAHMVRDGRLFRNILAADLQKKVEGPDKLCVLDVRTDNEWQGGHIPGATHVPVDDLEKQLHAVPRDGTPLYVICAGGGRSQAAAKFLAERGYVDVFNVEGGMQAWRGERSRD